jgi:divalent metal cation (Fe/Co/Zn/Cd) transporter
MPAVVGSSPGEGPRIAPSPLGQGRATYFWSFIVALLLFALGGLFFDLRGNAEAPRPAPLDAPWVAVTIVLIAMAAEGISLRVALKQVDKVRRGLSFGGGFARRAEAS